MMMISRRLAAALAAVCLVSPAWADITLTVNNAFGSYHVGDTITDPATVATVLAGPYKGYVVPSGSGTVSSPGAPGTVAGAQTGKDGSVNAPAIPNVGAAFGNSGPYANYVLLQSIPANQARLNVEIDNTSGAQIVIVRDDGTAAAGAAPVNATLIPLGAGAGVGAQGGSYTSNTFKGRLQIYAPSSSAFVSVSQE